MRPDGKVQIIGYIDKKTRNILSAKAEALGLPRSRLVDRVLSQYARQLAEREGLTGDDNYRNRARQLP